MRNKLVCWFSALALAFAGLCCFVDRVSAQENPPKPLPADLVANWKRELNNSCFERWMYQDSLGRIKAVDAFPKYEVRIVPVPGFEIYTDAVGAGTLAKLSAPEVPFGISCLSLAARNKEKTLPDFLLKEFAGMKNLRVLIIEERKVTTSGLKGLAAARNLQLLNLNNCTEVTDAVLKELVRIEGLKGLLLKHCDKVTDAGMKEIAKMKNLEVLSIEHTKVTDAGLRDLTGLKSLRLIYTSADGITPAGNMLLEKALPNCKVN